MKMSLDQINPRLVITGYGPGELQVGQQRYTASLLVTPDGVRPEWGPVSINDISGRHLFDLLEHRPEILILGTGESQQFPDPRLFIDLMDAGVGYEVMDTAAACRTYNVLLSEGRKVLGAFLL